MPNQQSAFLMDAFERALEKILARVSVLTATDTSFEQTQPSATPNAFAVAYSGGLDSAALLYLAHAYAVAHGIKLFAFHVHHGISPNADTWLTHCEKECTRLGIRFDARRVTLIERDRDGVEQAARVRRYAALGDLCRVHEVPLFLTAHHQDDQAETLLLQLLRGSGVAGLSGMEQANTASGLLGDADLIIGRPLLEISRAELEQFVAQRNIPHVEDESNTDVRFARNALRHKIMPSFSEYFPGFQQRLVRTAQHAQSARRLLNELGGQDLAVCMEAECIDIGRLKELSPDRIDNLLRYWFALHDIRMPSTAWLSEMREQLLDAREDAQIRVTHVDCEIRRHRDKVFLTPRRNDADLNVCPMVFRWNGEAQMSFPAYGGCLYFDQAEDGLDATWLHKQELLIRHRSGGERLKPAHNRPTKSLKHHYQTLNIPAWERLRLPVVTTVKNQLLFAAGIGMNWHDVPLITGKAIRMRWEKELP